MNLHSSNSRGGNWKVAVTQLQLVTAKWELLSNLLMDQKKLEIHVLLKYEISRFSSDNSFGCVEVLEVPRARSTAAHRRRGARTSRKPIPRVGADPSRGLVPTQRRPFPCPHWGWLHLPLVGDTTLQWVGRWWQQRLWHYPSKDVLPLSSPSPGLSCLRGKS